MTAINSASQTQRAVEQSRKELNKCDIHDPEFTINVQKSLMNDNLTDNVQSFVAYLAKTAEFQNNPDNIDLQTHNLPAQPPVVKATTITGPLCYSGPVCGGR